MITYYFISEEGKGISAPPADSEIAAVTDGATAAPELTATPAPPTQEPAASPEPTPSQEATEAPAAATPEPAATPDEAANADNTPGEDTGSTETNGPVSGLPENAAGNTVTLNFAGDVIFAGKAGELLQNKGYDYSYAALDGMFTKDDLTVVNLETPVTAGGEEAANKQYVFKSAPEALDALKKAGVDAVNLANNHTLDQGESGLLDTFRHLEERGIPYVGAGNNSEEAFAAQYFERNGIKIALLGFTRVIPHSDWTAGAGKPGVASVYDNTPGLKAIAAAKKKADLVIVVVHWGKERVEQYDTTQQELGHSLIDAGADLVIGGHPHVLQGIEPYKGKWIAYSTGNFIFTRSTVAATWETAVFQAECTAKGECALKLKPMHAELAQPVPMDDVSGQLLLKRVENLSAGLVRIDSDGLVSQAVR